MTNVPDLLDQIDNWVAACTRQIDEAEAKIDQLQLDRQLTVDVRSELHALKEHLIDHKPKPAVVRALARCLQWNPFTRGD